MTPKQRRQQDIFKRRLSGSAMTEKESKKIKGALSQAETPATAGAGVGALSGSAMTEKEFKKIKEALQQAPEGLEDEALQPGQEYGMKKGGKVKMHKMPGGKMMKNSDMKKKKKMGGGMMSDESFQYSKGGMVRGQGIAIRGTKFKGIF
jgi:hypothetical protein